MAFMALSIPSSSSSSEPSCPQWHCDFSNLIWFYRLTTATRFISIDLHCFGSTSKLSSHHNQLFRILNYFPIYEQNGTQVINWFPFKFVDRPLSKSLKNQVNVFIAFQCCHRWFNFLLKLLLIIINNRRLLFPLLSIKVPSEREVSNRPKKFTVSYHFINSKLWKYWCHKIALNNWNPTINRITI